MTSPLLAIPIGLLARCLALGGGIGAIAARLWAQSDNSRARFAACALAACCAMGGCYTRPGSIEDGVRVRVTSLERRLDAIPGRTLVARVAIDPIVINPDSLDPERTITGLVPVQLADGRVIAGELHRIRVRPPEETAARAWLPASRTWEAVSSRTFTVREAQQQGDDGFWALTVRLPERAQGDVRVVGHRLPIEWLEAWRAPRREAMRTAETDAQRAFIDMLRPVAADVAQRWRVRLLSDRRAPGVPGLADLLDEPLGNPALEAMDAQLTDRWRVALSLLGEVDQQLGERLLASLTRVVHIQGQPAPAWSSDEDGAAALLEALLNPVFPTTSKLERARGWLIDQQTFAAWVIDDAGARSPGVGVGAVTVGVAELRGSAAVVQARTAGGSAGPALGVGPWQSVVAVVSIDESDPPERVEAHFDGVVAQLSVAPAPVQAQPPGARMGPLRQTWEMDTWLAGRPVTPPAAWATAALLMKEASQEEWTLYIECRTPPDLFVTASGEDELVRVFLGAAGSAASILRVRATGLVQDETTLEDRSADATVRRDRDRWSVMLRVPAHAVDADGVLRVGLERLDARAQRSTWPRPVFPWQGEPGRMAFDLAGWNELN